ncbi:FTR1 family iron permease [Treponema phagedenis]|uniref:FTR1 family iron permease n=1 Tax=Treponema phagedenis TaxID=162 RepID=UPI0001F641AA|nr:FTR1 family protein [Treponema phagedenis]EFW39449.1 FTR1 family protein [Treponema phagedenis F0421]TYT79665.1 FTR1 family iron permease [Treponema phagedenis]
MKSAKQRVFVLCAVFGLLITLPIYAAGKDKKGNEQVQYSSWTQIVEQMEVHLNNAYDLYVQGKNKEAYNEVNTAYFRFYESKGMEKITMGYLSGKRKTAVENAFYQYRRNVKNDKDAKEVKEHKDMLIAMLYQDAAELDGVNSSDKSSGSSGNAISTFIASFVLVLREGLEAILVIAAIIAYLVKTGKQKYTKTVYLGAAAGVLVSILLAIVFSLIAGAQSGIAQEIFEGVGMLLAVVVLFYVSNWMISKSEVEAWDKYIRAKVEASVSTGNKWVLVLTAFLAVAREGAELILFFQGVPINDTSGRIAMWAAIILAAIVLAIIFFAFRFLSVKLPLKPFFIVTSVLMYILCVSFTGKGVSELQAAGVVEKTAIEWMNGFNIDLLGIYPTYETLIPQIVILLLTIASAVWYIQKNKKTRARLEAEAQKK